MFQYSHEDIHILNAAYLHFYHQTEAHLNFLVNFLIYQNLVDNYLHFCTTGELPLEVPFNDTSEEYLQDTYDFYRMAVVYRMPVFIHTRHRIKRITFEFHILNFIFVIKVRVYQREVQYYR
jgi:hypothetical protein